MTASFNKALWEELRRIAATGEFYTWGNPFEPEIKPSPKPETLINESVKCKAKVCYCRAYDHPHNQGGGNCKYSSERRFICANCGYCSYFKPTRLDNSHDAGFIRVDRSHCCQDLLKTNEQHSRIIQDI